SGLVLEWKIEIGDIVSPGDEIAVMEAMKMEQTIVAETSGVVAHFLVETGGFIDAEEDLIGLD
ncbi:MAG: acetyl-CoA carboxylase biotin carboxyl carrier protein subunit, partial [Alphaproteobacteria bacterium]|nr:acetyl-CoA carboxylase biotin carboxyl carrier protein subunit [Alphaproteobacteria bacterium]